MFKKKPGRVCGRGGPQTVLDAQVYQWEWWPEEWVWGKFWNPPADCGSRVRWQVPCSRH